MTDPLPGRMASVGVQAGVCVAVCVVVDLWVSA
jgi:hypothetical protein